MVRWYDYVAAFLAADFIFFFFAKGATSSTFWEPLAYGLLAGFIWRFWVKEYCNIRLKMEQKGEV